MKLSIVVPIYNVENYLRKCISSLLAQDLPADEYEIIIINDGSTDSSMVIADEYATRHSNIHLFSQTNKGVGAARNKGIDLAKGTYIYFIDPDDYLCANVLKSLLKYADHYKLDCLGFDSKNTRSANENICAIQFDRSLNINVTSGCTFIEQHKFKNEVWWYFINRSFLKNSGIRFIEGRWMEDAIFTAQLLLKVDRMMKIPVDCHRYVKVPDSAMNETEPEHYNKVIYDNANAAIKYNELLNNITCDNNGTIKKLRERQNSFVFF